VLAIRSLAARGWLAELRHRMWVHLPIKLIGVSAFTWLFFIAYFHLLRHPAHLVAVMPLTALDRAVPFGPGWLPVYLTLWFYVGIAPGLLLHLRELLVYGAWAAGLCLSGLVCFYLWPTAVPAFAVDVQAHPSFALLQGVDAAGNACPSLHVATAVFTAVWIDHLLRGMHTPAAWRLGNLVWVLAIAYSTLATRQHVAYDVLAGALLGLAWALVSLRGPRALRPERSV
jgi:membrane-associated phospholipid phosphatase